MNRYTLLYIEDDVETVENVTYLLKQYFKKIYIALDGEDALNKYHKYNPDIILSDIEIPKLDGLSLVTQIRKSNKYIPLIMMTAFNDNNKLLNAIDINISSYIKKPFTKKRLIEVIFKAIDEIEHLSLINNNLIMLHTDTQGIITEVTDAVVKISGYSKDELIGNCVSIFKSEHTRNEEYKELWSEISSGKEWHGELQNRKKDATHYWISSTITPIFDEKFNIKGYRSIQTDINKQKIAQNQAIKDSLTLLYNRTIFDTTFQKSIDLAKRYNTYFTYLMLDIDHFKSYNDTYGHLSGDKALQSVAKILNNSTSRADDYAFRIGGEEFAILLIGLDEKESLNFSNKIRESILALKIEHSKSSYKFLTISIGLYNAKGNNIVDKEKICSDSDIALYSSKNISRNMVSIVKGELEQ